MTFSRATRAGLLAFSCLVLVFIYAPLALVLLNSFNTSRTFEWPPTGSPPGGGPQPWRTPALATPSWSPSRWP